MKQMWPLRPRPTALSSCSQRLWAAMCSSANNCLCAFVGVERWSTTDGIEAAETLDCGAFGPNPHTILLSPDGPQAPLHDEACRYAKRRLAATIPVLVALGFLRYSLAFGNRR